MTNDFDERIIAAVRTKGPDVLPSTVCIEMDEHRLAKVIGRLNALSRKGILDERIVVDEKGRDRRAYSVVTGRRVEQDTSGSTRRNWFDAVRGVLEGPRAIGAGRTAILRDGR